MYEWEEVVRCFFEGSSNLVINKVHEGCISSSYLVTFNKKDFVIKKFHHSGSCLYSSSSSELEIIEKLSPSGLIPKLFYICKKKNVSLQNLFPIVPLMSIFQIVMTEN